MKRLRGRDQIIIVISLLIANLPTKLIEARLGGNQHRDIFSSSNCEEITLQTIIEINLMTAGHTDRRLGETDKDAYQQRDHQDQLVNIHPHRGSQFKCRQCFVSRQEYLFRFDKL